MATTIMVDTRTYRKAHGQEPQGRFLWTFRLNGTRSYFSARGEYEECLAKAIRHAEQKGIAKLSVSSVIYGQTTEDPDVMGPVQPD